jgi:hypothetical protein
MTQEELARRHLRFGWWSFAIFLTLGAVLEALHGFKVAFYLGPAAETRRLVWTLAHAHGTLLGLAHVAFGATVRLLPGAGFGPVESWSLIAGSVLLPAGFFLGGVVVYDGDPGLGIALVPLGVVFLITGSAIVGWKCGRRSIPPGGT